METVADQTLYSVELADTVDESCGSVHDSLEPIKLVLNQSINQSINLNFYSGLSSKDHC